jgi:hypothetical protein
MNNEEGNGSAALSLCVCRIVACLSSPQISRSSCKQFWWKTWKKNSGGFTPHQKVRPKINITMSSAVSLLSLSSHHSKDFLLHFATHNNRNDKDMASFPRQVRNPILNLKWVVMCENALPDDEKWCPR